MPRRSMLVSIFVMLAAVLVLQHTLLGGTHARAAQPEKSEEHAGRGLPELISRKHLSGGLTDDGTPPEAIGCRIRQWDHGGASAPHSGPEDQSARHAVRSTTANTARPLALLQVFRH